jgi:hypothetical protein
MKLSGDGFYGPYEVCGSPSFAKEVQPTFFWTDNVKNNCENRTRGLCHSPSCVVMRVGAEKSGSNFSCVSSRRVRAVVLLDSAEGSRASRRGKVGLLQHVRILWLEVRLFARDLATLATAVERLCFPSSSGLREKLNEY